MPKMLEPSARFLAYRWYLWMHLDASPREAWSYARTHWQEFMGRQPECLEDDNDSDFFSQEKNAEHEVLVEN